MCMYASPYPEKVHATRQCKTVMPPPVWLLFCKSEMKGRDSVYESCREKEKLTVVWCWCISDPSVDVVHAYFSIIHTGTPVCCVCVEGVFSPLCYFAFVVQFQMGAVAPCSLAPLLAAPLLPCSLFSLFPHPAHQSTPMVFCVLCVTTVCCFVFLLPLLPDTHGKQSIVSDIKIEDQKTETNNNEQKTKNSNEKKRIQGTSVSAVPPQCICLTLSGLLRMKAPLADMTF